MSQQTDHLVPRYEFRTFDKNLDQYFDLLKNLTGIPDNEIQKRYSEETYFLNGNLTDINCKVRNDILDIKKLLEKKNDLEQWYPVYKHDFPLPQEELIQIVFPLLRIRFPRLRLKGFSFNEWINLIQTVKHCYVVPVKKTRFGFELNKTICEFAEVQIAKTVLQSIACESENVVKVKETISILQIDKFENTSYPKVIRQVLKEENKF